MWTASHPRTFLLEDVPKVFNRVKVRGGEAHNTSISPFMPMAETFLVLPVSELAPALNQPQLSQQYNDRTWVFVKYPRFSFAFSKKFNYYTSSSSRMIRFLSPCCWKSGLLNDVELVSPGQVISTGVLVLVSVIQRALRHNAPSMSWIEKQNISSLWHLNTV